LLSRTETRPSRKELTVSHAESSEAALRCARPIVRDRKRSRTEGTASTTAGQRSRREAAAIALLTVLAITATACGGAEPDPHPARSPSITSSPPTSSPTPTKSPNAWRSKFNTKQLKAYDAALQRWTDYENRSEPIWARGKATPAAKALFKEYFASPAWVAVWNTLKTYDKVDVTSTGQISVYWSRAKSISADATDVTVKQCIDYTTLHGFQRGKPTIRSAWMKKPQARTIRLYRARGYDWLIARVIDATGGKDRPCEP